MRVALPAMCALSLDDDVVVYYCISERLKLETETEKTGVCRFEEQDSGVHQDGTEHHVGEIYLISGKFNHEKHVDWKLIP